MPLASCDGVTHRSAKALRGMDMPTYPEECLCELFVLGKAKYLHN